jgi:predicted nucleic acid-binding protein
MNPANAPVQGQWRRWENDGIELVAPALFGYEVVNALYRYAAYGSVSADAVESALDTVLAMPLRYHDHPQLHRRALRLASQLRLPAAYDAQYLALAELQGITFWTADQRLANTVRAVLPWVHLVGE